MPKVITISFILPSLGDKPGGGYKIVLEYANRFLNSGITVNVVYPILVRNRGVLKNIIGTLYRIIRLITNNYSARKWFEIDSSVNEVVVWRISDKYLPISDLYIATAVRTAIDLQKCKIPKRKKMYFIQGYESWDCPEDLLEETFRYGMTNIVVSNWLKDILEQKKIKAYLVRNAFDFGYFKLSNSIRTRDKFHISMQYSENPIKGTKYGLEAIRMLKQTYPMLKVSIFGIYERPRFLDKWIEYYQKPDKETHNYIYNCSSIFIAPSINEGWGLTVGEAMICGNAVVCTENKGHLEMASDMDTALLCPIENTQSIYELVVKLIEDDNLRWKIAKRSHENIKQFSWEKSVEDFYKILKDSTI